VNLSTLDELGAGSQVTPESLFEARIIRKKKIRVKILGTGELTKKLNVTAHAFSQSARKKIEAAGGTVTVIDSPQTEEAPGAETAKTAE
ncbi:MAG: uL15 family ribosomal protein, partial [Chloroflexi bacterium]|nr:uL15 family ribosomal protein [Chloroflexota bacterium]